MLRSSRIVLMVLVAVFVVAVPTAVAQTPVGDQYQTDDTVPPDDFGNGPAEDSGNAPAETSAAVGGSAPVEVRSAARAGTDSLPFTGAQVSLIALIGLGLLAGGVGLAMARRRGSPTAS